MDLSRFLTVNNGGLLDETFLVSEGDCEAWVTTSGVNGKSALDTMIGNVCDASEATSSSLELFTCDFSDPAGVRLVGTARFGCFELGSDDLPCLDSTDPRYFA